MNHERLGEYLTPYRQMAEPMMGTGRAALRMLNLSITQQAGMVAYVNVFLLLSILSVIFVPLLFFIRAGRQRSQQPGEAADAMAH